MTDTVDDLFRALAQPTRRRVLFALQRRADNEESPLDTLDALYDSDPDSRQHVRLLHIDLPFLETVDLIEWNEGDTVVTPGSQFDAIRPLLRVIVAELSRASESG